MRRDQADKADRAGYGDCAADPSSTCNQTGTCDGACDHYLGCKHNSDPAAKLACTRECGQVLSPCG